ncbi:hypothetical protein [Ferrimonas pelagia]|uniref:Uncharacterized protein n=1 Tax=Ferrimonas pelagia TaxID=1177826 RepID=A0ABP9EUI4_9GAMM
MPAVARPIPRLMLQSAALVCVVLALSLTTLAQAATPFYGPKYLPKFVTSERLELQTHADHWQLTISHLRSRWQRIDRISVHQDGQLLSQTEQTPQRHLGAFHRPTSAHLKVQSAVLPLPQQRLDRQRPVTLTLSGPQGQCKHTVMLQP